MDLRSPFDEVPEGFIHQPEELAQTRTALDQLALSVRDAARRALRDSAARATAHSSMRVLEDEAKAVLRQLLEDPDEVEEALSEDDDAERGDFHSALEDAIAGDLCSAIESTEDQWLEMTSADLARALATFWWNLGHDHWARGRAASRLFEGRDPFLRDGLLPLTERFGLTSAELLQLLEATRQPSLPMMAAAGGMTSG